MTVSTNRPFGADIGELFMIKRVVGIYFSPSGEVAKITKRITTEIAEQVSDMCIDTISSEFIDMLKQPPSDDLRFDEQTVAIIGMPAYNGRIPLPCVKMMQKLHGNDTLSIALVSYGNSTYGDSLYELYSFAEDQGFQVISAGAFVVQHPMFGKIAASRPDANDLKKILEFCEISANKMKRFCTTEIGSLRAKPAPLEIKGSMPTKLPSRVPIHPTPNDFCIKCGKCAEICPVNAIDLNDPTKVDSKKCISCTACIRACEQEARGFRGPMCAASRIAFEMLYSKRKDPEWFI